MCNLYDISPKGDAERYIGAQGWLFDLDDYEAHTVRPNQRGVFLRPGSERRTLRSQVGQWGMIRHGSPPPRPGDKRHASASKRGHIWGHERRVIEAIPREVNVLIESM